MRKIDLKRNNHIVYRIMGFTNFNLAKCKSLPFLDAITYIQEYFIPLDDGTHAYKYNEKWEIRTDDIIKQVFFNRLSPLLNDYYFKEYDKILHPVYDKTKTEFYDDCINFDYKEINIDLPYKFLIDEYINKKLGLSIKPKELFDLYIIYAKTNNTVNKTKFITALKNVGIVPFKSNTSIYKKSFDELFEIGLKNQWYYKEKKDIVIELLKNENEKLKREIDAKVDKEIDEIDEEVDEEINEDEEILEDEVILEDDEEPILEGEDLIETLFST